MDIEYIVVQAGGKGTRLEYLTENKPKALVPVNNLPMIFHLFRKYPEKRFIVIGDYKKDVLERYLAVFANVRYIVSGTEGEKGTCSGVRKALTYIPPDEPFMLIWSDLILAGDFVLPEECGNYIGISRTFPCRWKFEGGRFTEERSMEYGVAGMFIFEKKSLIDGVPSSGELVRWLKDREIDWKTAGLEGAREFGILEEYLKTGRDKCRPFNRMTVEGDRLIKKGIDRQGKELAVRECNWYKAVQAKGFSRIPKIYNYDPIVMEKIEGKNIYEYGSMSYKEKKEILSKLIEALNQLHSLGKRPVDYFSLKEAYFNKTLARIKKIRDLVPFADQRYITVNGRKCRNVFYFQKELEKRLDAVTCSEFQFLHGDCTFSNLMLREEKEPVFIDPRGYFGFNELYGDPLYDWAKLYYSLKGNYDRFNLKDFRLHIHESGVDLQIASNGWEELEEDFFDLIGKDVQREEIKLIHAVIWLSLTTYAWEDYDSICGAFYNGIYYLEEVL